MNTPERNKYGAKLLQHAVDNGYFRCQEGYELDELFLWFLFRHGAEKFDFYEGERKRKYLAHLRQRLRSLVLSAKTTGTYDVAGKTVRVPNTILAGIQRAYIMSELPTFDFP